MSTQSNWMTRWGKTIATILGAIALGFAVARASRSEERADHNEKLAENILQNQTKKAAVQAGKLQAMAKKDKEKGVVARKQMEDQLEKLGENNASMDELAHHFNSKRVRHNLDDTAAGS